MPNPGSIIGAMTDELGELGKQIVSETVKAPKDMTGKALESLGLGSGKKSGNKSQITNQPAPKTQAEAENQAKQMELKKAVARAALAELAGGKKQKEPSVWERIQKEEEQKKEMKKQQQAQAAKSQLPKSGAKRARGDLYGMKAKKAAAEMSRNVKSD